jgi:hypothetical protein
MWVEIFPFLTLGLLLILALAGGIALTRRLVGREDPSPKSFSAQSDAAAIPPGITVKAQTVLTSTEASFYNVLRLAVQDRYLVLAQVPLWCLIDVEAPSREVFKGFLNKIALKRVDFVLIHPGTLSVAKVVELDVPTPSAQRQTRDHLVDRVFKAAGIEVVRLKTDQSFTVPALAALLGLELVE